MIDEQERRRYLQTMGIDTWENKVVPTAFPAIANAKISEMNVEALRKCVAACTACGLHKTRTQTVFGVGSLQAELMLIGEAPGATEDQLGEPFVGRAGKLLDAMLRAINLDRKQVFIANILKCRPPNNRDPNPEEVEQCLPFLERQIALVQPKLIVALGRIASHFLLKTQAPLSTLRGKFFHYGERKTPLLVTYHPAYLLRSPREKAKAYDDFREVMKILTKGNGKE